MQVEAVKLEIFIPEDHIEPLRHALHTAGVGRIGLYDHSAYQSRRSQATGGRSLAQTLILAR